ncbi:MAG: amino acid adenylation domain-containing protein, partial [Undibacterium sp.]|nr:amino acid adenylation domain-containing protein [Undibacterium sp.]
LSGLPTVHGLPLDFVRPQLQSFVGATVTSQISAATRDTLKALCLAKGATLFMGLHAAFSVLLSRYSNETDIVVGSPIANREQAEVAGLIGFFVNTLVLRSDLAQNSTFEAILEQSKHNLLDAYLHQQVPFEQIVERLQPQRSLSHSPVFQIMLVLQNIEVETLALPGLILSPAAQDRGIAKYDLTLTIGEGAQGLELGWEYSSALFKATTIQSMAGHFENLLNALVAMPQKNVFALDILSDTERNQLTKGWNHTENNYPTELCLHQLFEQQVASTPDAIAVTFAGQQWSYAALNQRANQLAHYLVKEMQVQPDSLIGICVERSLDMLVGILGILKAGAAYLPLDPDYPQARLAYMVQDANLQTIITQKQILNSTSFQIAQALCLDDEHVQMQLSSLAISNLDLAALTSNHLAYVIYTSGSTGQPKGVMIEHRSVVNFLSSMQRKPGIQAQDKLLAVTSTAFDIHGLELFLPLSVGAQLVIASRADSADPEALIDLMESHRINFMQATPATWKMLLASAWQQTTPLTALCGGEALGLSLAKDLLAQPGLTLWNLYGPTETTIWSCCKQILPDTQKILLGQAIDNTQVFVVGVGAQLAPVGVAGELWIGGAGLARGYLHKPELTADKFVINPYYDETDPNSSTRLYKTGDLVRYLTDGNLEYVGRIDHQVKLRGFRIELGEIENTLITHQKVQDAVVVIKESKLGDPSLVAYVVIDEAHATTSTEVDGQTSMATLRHHVAQTLPDYMLPTSFVFLDKLPLTPNGKLDRKALPEPDREATSAHYLAPSTAIEKILSALWQDVLGVERVGLSDNFFHLGGHSLSATRVVGKLNQALNLALPLKSLFVTPNLGALAELVLQHSSQLSLQQRLDSGRPPLVRVSRDRVLLPSFTQQRLWLLDQIDGGSAHYHLTGALKLSGELNYAALSLAFSTILERHESLRTCFELSKEGNLSQVILAPRNLTVTVSNLTELPLGEQQMQVVEQMSEEFSKAFNLRTDLMLRAHLLQLAANQHILLVTMHHIASDGWSMGILIKEFSALYSAYSQGQGNPLSPLEIQYADYAQWQRNWLQGDELERQLGYWTRQLADLPVVHNLPLDYDRPVKQSFIGETIFTRIDTVAVEALKSLCSRQGASLFMGLHAAFSVLLSRYSNETDIVLGSPIANREQIEVAPLIGFFVNTLVLRSDLSQSPTFMQLVQQSRDMLLDAYTHQQVPFEQIVERLQPPRSISHSPLFQIMLVMQNNEGESLELPGLSLAPLERSIGIAKYDLTLTAIETEQGLELSWEYNADLFESNTVASMAQHFEQLLSIMLQMPEEKVADVAILNDAQYQQQVFTWNNTATSYPQEKCVHQLFEQQVDLNPDGLALIFEDQQISYQELNQKANQLAHYLRQEKAISPDTLVGICLERSIDMVVSMLAVLKAGAAYVPLDPDYPSARLGYMLEDAQLATVITIQKLLSKTPITEAQALCLDTQAIQAQLARLSVENIDVVSLNLTSNHLAYLIYTSGSTGQPKGAALPHRGVVNYLDYAKTNYFNQVVGAVVSSPLAFDATVTSLLGPLVSGKWVKLLSSSGQELAQLSQEMRTLQVPVLFKITPAHLEALAHYLPNGLVSEQAHMLVIGGDQLSSKVAHHWKTQLLPLATLVNEYGPTETVVGCSTFFIREAEQIDVKDAAVSIGRGINNTQLFVLKDAAQLLPLQLAGELLIGGAGLARGYLNRVELTAEKFITNPFHDATDPNSSERLYRTGDLVRWRLDGNLEFLGRIDHQVKLRGFRIELGEIEAALGAISTVSEVVVQLREDVEGDKRLVAYLVPHTDCVIDEAYVRGSLSSSLPEHMVPAHFITLDTLPLTANGKLDRKALPTPDMLKSSLQYVEPKTAIEKNLCSIWQDILGVEQVGVNDNFFQLGGHSILAVQLIARLQEVGINMSIAQLFANSTLADLAAALEQGMHADTVKFSAPANLIPQDCQHITPDILAMVELSLDDIALIVTQIPGGAANIQDIYPLAPLQEGILFHHMMSEQGDPYVLSGLMRIDSRAMVEAFIAALQSIVDRHDVMRTAILWHGLPMPVQVVCRKADLPVTWLTLTPTSTVDTQTQMQALCAPHLQRMVLTQAPLLRLQIGVEEHTGQHFVMLQYHHIISDHVGLEIIQKEVGAYLTGHAGLLPVPTPYREFVAHALHQARTQNSKEFFTEMLADVDEMTAPFNLLDVHGDGSRIVDLVEELPAALSSKIRGLARSHQINPASLFHTAWALVVAACSGRKDVVFGTVLSGRLQGTVDAENMLGMFINTLPIRVKLSDTNCLDLVRQVERSLRDLLSYEQASLTMAQSCSGVSGSLFSAMINYRHSAADGSHQGETELARRGITIISAQERTNYPFNLSVDDLGLGFRLDVQIDAAVSAARVLGYVQTAVAALVDGLLLNQDTPEAAVSHIRILPEQEQRQILQDWNDTAVAYPAEKCIHELFEAQVQQRPNAIALVFEEQELSYAELNRRANQLAHYLVKNKDVTPDSLVGICLERSLDMVIAILGILKAGAAYVPLDPDYPTARLAYMLEDAQLATVLTQTEVQSRTPMRSDQAVCVDDEVVQTQLLAQPNMNLQIVVLNSAHLAYVIYTSGSTGNPKGVMVEHRSVVNLLCNIQGLDLGSPSKHWGWLASYAFDASIQGLSQLVLGQSLRIIPDASRRDPTLLLPVLDSLAVIDCTPMIVEAWFAAGLADRLPHLLIGGEAISQKLWDLLLEWQEKYHKKAINVYGPTECTVDSTSCLIAGHFPHIGKPMGNMLAYVLNDAMSPRGVGIRGELFIGGVGLARGYLHRLDMTADKFVDNPFYDQSNPASSGRLYKTGDLACWLPDGNLEFFGRIDDQVKIRGHRIELGEIEVALMAQGVIQEAAVLAHEGFEGDKRLVAYLVPSPEIALDETSLREALSRSLPDYMIPAYFIVLEDLPLTANGKLDRKALPKPDQSQLRTEYVAPRTETERLICEIWQEVL